MATLGSLSTSPASLWCPDAFRARVAGRRSPDLFETFVRYKCSSQRGPHPVGGARRFAGRGPDQSPHRPRRRQGNASPAVLVGTLRSWLRTLSRNLRHSMASFPSCSPSKMRSVMPWRSSPRRSRGGRIGGPSRAPLSRIPSDCVAPATAAVAAGHGPCRSPCLRCADVLGAGGDCPVPGRRCRPSIRIYRCLLPARDKRRAAAGPPTRMAGTMGSMACVDTGALGARPDGCTRRLMSRVRPWHLAPKRS